MELKFTYYSDVNDGKLQANVSDRIRAELAAFEGKRVEITIRKNRSKRSIEQNRLLWLYTTILSTELGYEKNEMHEIIKYKFLRRERVDEKTGEVFEYVGSTTGLTKSEFADLINELIRWAAQVFHISLPMPSEQLTID